MLPGLAHTHAGCVQRLVRAEEILYLARCRMDCGPPARERRGGGGRFALNLFSLFLFFPNIMRRFLPGSVQTSRRWRCPARSAEDRQGQLFDERGMPRRHGSSTEHRRWRPTGDLIGEERNGAVTGRFSLRSPSSLVQAHRCLCCL
jgi:hypothetical protein